MIGGGLTMTFVDDVSPRAALAAESIAALAERIEHGEYDVSMSDLIGAGRFVVVQEVPVYSRINDALIGCDKIMLSDHATREEADAACPESREEEYYYVLPREAAPPQTHGHATDDDIPL